MNRYIYLPPGTIISVFDSKLWNYKDVGDNSQFWKNAEVVEINGDTVTVKFMHDGRISRGHFISMVQEAKNEETQ